MKKIKDFILKYQNKLLVILFILIVLLQVALRVQVGNEKAYFHIDEGYSYGLMNYKNIDLISNDDIYETWHDKEYYTDYFSISSDEAWNLKPVYENQKNDVHPPFYYALLRIAASFTIDSFSKWTGIILNIFIFVLSSIFIYLIANKVFKNKLYAMFIVLVSGFTIASIETTIFIRMYALNALNLLIVTYLHIINYKKENLGLKELIPMSICTILGSLTHYYYLIFLLILFIMYAVKFVRRKDFINLIKYIVMLAISALVSLAIFPYSFVHIFIGYRGAGAVSNLKQIEEMWSSLGIYFRILNSNVFNGVLIFIVLLILGIGIYRILKNKKIILTFKNTTLWLTLLPSITYFVIVALVSPYREIRYIMPICPFIVIGIFYLIKIVLEKILSPYKTFVALNIIFIIMLIFPIVRGVEITYLYKHYDKKLEIMEEQADLPILYILNTNNNRLLDDIYLLSKMNNSYILDLTKFTEKKVEEIFKETDISKGITVIISKETDHKMYLNTIKRILNLSNDTQLISLRSANIYKISNE